MRLRLCAVVAGLIVVGAGTVAGPAAAAGTGAGAGPVASAPSSPQTQTVSGVAANGVQLSVTAPVQLPLDLPGQQLPEREVDVTVKDVGGQGYTGAVTMALQSEGSGVSSTALRLDHYDLTSDTWQSADIPSGESSFTVTDNATVPAGGTQVLKLRLSPGTTAVDDVKLTVSANGASAVATMPVTGPAFQASGLTAGARAGAPTVITGKLTNPTDVDFQHVSVKLLLCSAGTAGCVAHASDVKVDAAVGSGAWHSVPVADGSTASPMSATVVPDLEVVAGGGVNVSVRVTVGAGAFGGAQPSGPGQPSGSAGQPSSTPSSSSQAPAQPMAVPLALGPLGLTLAGQPNASGTLTVQPPPQAPPSTPSSSPSSSASSSSPSATPTTSAATDTPTATASDTPTPNPVSSTEAASTPGASSSSSSPTILVAIGLLAVCLALVLWWTSMKRRERLAQEAAAGVGVEGEDLVSQGQQAPHEE